MTLQRIAAGLAVGLAPAIAPLPAMGQDTPAKAPPKGCIGPGFADFDFWLGEWDV
ncbi:MAG: hypothetical protein ACE5ED_12635 [Rhodothalassiaceae bacterium]